MHCILKEGGGTSHRIELKGSMYKMFFYVELVDEIKIEIPVWGGIV